MKKTYLAPAVATPGNVVSDTMTVKALNVMEVSTIFRAPSASLGYNL